MDATVIDTSGTDHQIAAWIWRHLVPKQGQADTLQGELLRAVEKLRWEAQENGNINWDEGFVLLLDFLETRLLALAVFSPADRESIRGDIARLRRFTPVGALGGLDGHEGDASAQNLPCVDDAVYDRLTAFVVAYAKAQPRLQPHAHDARLHR